MTISYPSTVERDAYLATTDVYSSGFWRVLRVLAGVVSSKRGKLSFSITDLLYILSSGDTSDSFYRPLETTPANTRNTRQPFITTWSDRRASARTVSDINGVGGSPISASLMTPQTGQGLHTGQEAKTGSQTGR